MALGYGTLVPLVPVYLDASGGGDVAWHTGALPDFGAGIILLALALAALMRVRRARARGRLI